MSKIRKFDTKVQYLKYKVLREVARHAWDDTLLEAVLDIPETIAPGKIPTMRCCVYKERAILYTKQPSAEFMAGGCFLFAYSCSFNNFALTDLYHFLLLTPLISRQLHHL